MTAPQLTADCPHCSQAREDWARFVQAHSHHSTPVQGLSGVRIDCPRCAGSGLVLTKEGNDFANALFDSIDLKALGERIAAAAKAAAGRPADA